MSKKYKKYTVIFSLIAVAALIFAVLPREDKPMEEDLETDKQVGEPYRLLVLGEDRVSGLTDVMMLVSLDTESGRICVMQIPRDTYADYGSNAHRKLNAARGYLGGERELCDFLGRALGIEIDGYAAIDLDAFGKAVDAIGGVEMTLDSTLYYDDPAQGLHIYLQKGEHILNGEQAEMLVRYRSGYLRGDLDRLDVQKRFMIAFFKSLRESVTPVSAYKLASELLPHINTDVDASLAVSLGLKALKTQPEQICLVTLPGREVRGKSGGSFYVMSAVSAKEIIEQYFTTGTVELDIGRVFRHPTNTDFSEVYDSKVEYSAVFGDKIG